MSRPLSFEQLAPLPPNSPFKPQSRTAATFCPSHPSIPLHRMSRYRDLDVGVETPSPAAASQPKPPHGRKPLTLGRAPEFSDLSPTRNPETLRPHTRPNPCEVKFRGDHGISFEGTRVSHSVLQAGGSVPGGSKVVWFFRPTPVLVF